MANEKQEVRFLPKVADAYFKVNGNLAFIAKANTAANVNITTQRTDKRGGQDNAIIGTIFSDSAVEIGFTSASWQPEFLAASIGSVIQTRDGNFYSENLSYTVDAEGKITLTEEPSDGKIYVMKNGGYLAIPVTELEVDVSDYGFKEGDCISCVAMIKRNGNRIGISTDITPTTGNLTLSSPLFSGTKGRIGTAEYVFPNFQFGGSFNHQFSTDASYELSGVAIATGSDICGNKDEFGYYQEYLNDEDTITTFTQIVASPAVMELELEGDSGVEKGKISVYGLKNALYDRIPISSDLAFAVDGEGSTYVNVGATSGEVTPVQKTSDPVTITVTYKNTLTATVQVYVV